MMRPSESLFSFLKKYDTIDGRRLPQAEQYSGYYPVVMVIQVVAVLLVAFLGLLWLKDTIQTPGIVWVIIPLIMIFVICLYGLSYGAAFLVGLIAKSYIKNQSLDEAEELYQTCNPQWKSVTPQMQEYLGKNKNVLRILLAVATAGVAVMTCVDRIYGIVIAVAVIYSVRLGLALLGGNVFEYGSDTEYAVIHIDHTFTRYGVRYAVVYLPIGKRVYRLDKKAGDNPERLVFLSCGKNARLICNEEFFNLID